MRFRSLTVLFFLSMAIHVFAQHNNTNSEHDDLHGHNCSGLEHLAIDSILESDTNAKYFFHEEDYKDSLEVYEARFGENKFVPDSLKLPFYVALSYYPELHNSKIKIEGRIMFTTMEARPANSSVFKKADNRTYKVYINNRKGKSKGINLAKLNFNSRVGFFGHELAHLLSYQNRNSFELLGMGLKYVFSKKYKRYTERETDLETIKRGLGYPLYESKKRILKDKSLGTSRAYRRNARKNYMTDAEVLQSIFTIGLDNIAFKE